MEEILHQLIGSLSHYLHGFSTIPGGCWGFQPSTVPNSPRKKQPAFQELAELWPLSSELSERLSLQLVTLQERMAKACATASAEDQEPKLKAGTDGCGEADTYMDE